MSSITESCFWLASRSTSAPPVALTEHIDAEIAIVGAGFTGLWTAWFLKQLEPKLDIVVLEQGVCGYGGSGRNAGIVSNCLDHSHALAIAHFGLEEAARLAKLGIDNIDELAQFAQGCDFERSGQLTFALTEGHMEECQKNIKVASELGLEGYRLMTEQEAKAEINSPLYKGALYSQGGGIINPIKLVDRIKMEASKAGVRFFETTRVEGFDGTKIRVGNGSVNARKIVLATDSYSHHLFPHLLNWFIPLYDYILVSDPLSKSDLDSIGWRNRQGVTDGRTFFNYYRLTADNRILWGTSEAMYYPPNKVEEKCDHSEAHYKTLTDSFRRHFPQLAHLQFKYRWGGPIASTTRLTPFFGSLLKGHIVYALGYTGHGIGTTRVAGKILAHLALMRSHDLLKLKLVTKKPFPYPPEPLRSFAVNAVTSSLRQLDEGKNPNILLRTLDALGIGFSS